MAFESEEEHVEVPEAEEQEGEAQIVEEINGNEGTASAPKPTSTKAKGCITSANGRTGKNTASMDKQHQRFAGCGSHPFDKVMMHEMINYLLAVSWFSYVPKRKKNPDIDGIIASCFDKFIEEVVNTAPSRYD
ncbi:unnamed protein product, partial [Nesidiocoris tenuis]